MLRKFYRDYAIFTAILLSLILGLVLLADKMIDTATITRPKAPQIFVIDAGHGGEDGGAVSISGVSESHYNLQIANCLSDLLKLLGYHTYMLRTGDHDLHTEGNTIAQRKVSDLKQRVKIVNQFHNATLISIHQNYFNDSRYSGLQTFYFKNTSKELAERIQAYYKTYISPASRRLAQRKNDVYLLEHVQCDAVLIECGFISNKEEELRLQNTKYRQKLAGVIASSLLSNGIS